jgi:hypothetical protein
VSCRERKKGNFGKTKKITNRVENFGTEPYNFNQHFSSFCFPRFLIEVMPNKCFIFNRIANFEQNLQVEDFVMFVGWLSHPITRQTNVAADSDCRLAFARSTFLAAELGVRHRLMLTL